MMKQERKTGYKSKSYSIEEIKLEDSTMMVEGYFASTGNIDSDNDKIMSGAFDSSIQKHGPNSPANRKIAHLAFHDVTRPVGVIKELREDDNGLYFRSKLGSHAEGKDAFLMYKDGIIREHSIGFNYIPEQIVFMENAATPEKSFFEIHEVKLWEGSFVTFGANSETPNLSGAKSQEEICSMLDILDERMEVFIKALTDKNYSEKFNRMAEVELMQIKQSYNELVRYEPIDKQKIADTQKSRESSVDLTNIINTIKI